MLAATRTVITAAGSCALFVAFLALAVCPASAGAAVLADQWSNFGSGVHSQDFNNDGVFNTGGVGVVDSQSADDFVVPAGERWSISGVDAHGQYVATCCGASAGPAQSVDVFFYQGSATQPVGTPIARTGQSWTDLGGGQLRISLSSPVTLTAGTYWVSVWVHQNSNTHGWWGWSTRMNQSGASGHHYGITAASNCGPPMQWRPIKTCYNEQTAGPDLAWRLHGIKKDTLIYQSLGNGNGRVVSTPAGINCAEGECLTPAAYLFDDGTRVSLAATAAINDVFTGWTGCDQPSGATCVMQMNTPAAAKTVKATFVEGARLSFRKTGAGDGRVVPSSGAPCEIGQCKTTAISWKFVKGSQATITAHSTTEARFAGWTGCDRPSGSSCVMDMNAAKSLSARYEPTAGITVTKEGEGDGTLESDPPAVDCALGECRRATFFRAPADTQLRVTATPRADGPASSFAGWTGCDRPEGRTCFMAMGAAGTNRTLKARFDPGKLVTVAKAGSGSGRVTSSVEGIDCGTLCTTAFVPGSDVALAAHPDPGSTFTGWSGACSGSGVCGLAMNEDRAVTASFAKETSGDTPPATSPPVATPGGPFAPGDLDAPTLTKVRVKVAKNRQGSLTLTSSEAGGVTIKLLRVRSGRKVGRSCSPRARKGKRCKFYAKFRSVSKTINAGANTIALGRKLPKGRHRAKVTASDAAGNTSRPVTVSFTVR